jgi:glucose-1-phosphate thymidylyltransferase
MGSAQVSNQPFNVIGLLPAAGYGTRLSPLPFSKELYPVGFQADAAGLLKPKPVGQYLLENLRRAGIRKAFWILRPGKWDIPAHFGDGASLDMHLAYLTVQGSQGVPYTLNQAFPFIEEAVIALGFPDILFQPDDAYQLLLTRLQTGKADVVLGLFPTTQPWKVGMVDVDATGQVRQILEKPPQSPLKYMWAIAVWRPSFSQFLNDYVQRPVPDTELPIGNVIQASLAAGLRVEAEIFAEGSYLDVGTPDDLATAIRRLTPPGL